MLHIVFQEADVSVLQKAIALDEKLSGDVWQIKDEFAVGPLANIYETQGYQNRRNWWIELLQHSPYTKSITYCRRQTYRTSFNPKTGGRPGSLLDLDGTKCT